MFNIPDTLLNLAFDLLCHAFRLLSPVAGHFSDLLLNLPR
jgi:hypothetical protein